MPIFGTGLPWAWASIPNAFSEAGSHVAIYHKEVVILLVSLRCLMFDWKNEIEVTPWYPRQPVNGASQAPHPKSKFLAAAAPTDRPPGDSGAEKQFPSNFPDIGLNSPCHYRRSFSLFQETKRQNKFKKMRRRNFLRSAGCTLMLPALESFGQEAKGDDSVKANRLFCMNIGNGMCSDNFPTSTGKDYQSTSTFKPLEHLKKDFTLCTNLRNYGNHFDTMYAFAEYADHGNPQLIRDSVDEIAASHLGYDTRIRNLVVEQRNSVGISWKGGLAISPITNSQVLFQKIFGQVDREKRAELLALKKSMLDATRKEAKRLSNNVSKEDRDKLDEYFSSLRESEKSIQRAERWLSRKQVEVPFPENVKFDTQGCTEYLQKILADKIFNERSTYLDLLFLAYKYDVTRVANVYGEWNWSGHHTDSHQVQNKEGYVKTIEADQAYMMQTARFLGKLQSTKTKSGATLLDQTVCLITSSLSISKEEGPHGYKNNPVIVAGGGFDHNKHIRFNGVDNRNNIYLAALQHLGCEIDSFATSSASANL